MLITVLGATGMVGTRAVAEAATRGHELVAASRSGAPVEGAARAVQVELADTASIVDLINAADATIIAIPPSRTGDSHEPTVQAHRDLIAAAPSGRILVVGGAGSLESGDGLLKDTEGFPPEYLPEATTFTQILDLYRASEGLDWTVLSPAPVLAPGERTGTYQLGLDSPVGSSISVEDFGVALVDEVESPAHRGRRFTVAN